jgi:hypothetical protein
MLHRVVAGTAPGRLFFRSTNNCVFLLYTSGSNQDSEQNSCRWCPVAPLVLITPKSLWFLWRKKRVLPLLGTAGEKTGSLPVSPRGEGFSKGVTRAFISALNL